MRKSSLYLLFILVFLTSSIAVNVHAEDQCKDILIVFARGSGQNPNNEYLDDLSNPNYFGKKEVQSYTFFKEISSRLNGVSVEKVSLHDFTGKYNQYGYAAVDVASGFAHGPNHRKDVSNRYYESVKMAPKNYLGI